MILCHAIVAAAHLGRIDEARAQAERMKTLHPDYTINSLRTAVPYHDSDKMEHYVDGMRKAGVAE